MHNLLKKNQSRKIRKILVRSVNWIGDAVMTTPAMARIRNAFPEAEIVVVANPLVAQLFLHHPSCDRVITFDKKSQHRGATGFLRFCHALRRERFDLAVLLQNAIEAALMATFAMIPRRAGYKTDGRGLLLNYGVPAVDSKHGLHHVDYYLQMLESIGLKEGCDSPQLFVTADEQQDAAQLLPGDHWLAVNPGAAYGSAKRWIPERFAAVADRLAETHGLQVVLTGGSAEQAIGSDIEKNMRCHPVNLIGKTNVRQLMAVLDRCRLMVTNDSGPMHVAAALGVPIVAIFGPTDHTTTSPRTDRCRIVRHHVNCSPCLLRQCPIDHRCMTGVTTEAVVEAANELMAMTT